jgi:lipoic acid synthetase
MNQTARTKRKPDWLKVTIPGGVRYFELKSKLREKGLPTICQSARCPNIGECWNHNQATLLIMGQVCTRDCLFCSVPHGVPVPLDASEARNVLEMSDLMDLSYLVVTSVTRDDLPDKGSGHFAGVIRLLKSMRPQMRIEVLVPDFAGEETLLQRVLQAGPDVLAHNLEAVPGIYPRINRSREGFRHSLHVLETSKKAGQLTKTGIMVGLGETLEEVRELFGACRALDVDLLTIGQYLQPDRHCVPVAKYYSPEEFLALKELALGLGFKAVEAGPFIRSSYRAEQLYEAVLH